MCVQRRIVRQSPRSIVDHLGEVFCQPASISFTHDLAAPVQGFAQRGTSRAFSADFLQPVENWQSDIDQPLTSNCRLISPLCVSYIEPMRTVSLSLATVFYRIN
jgi:hypothetical protein